MRITIYHNPKCATSRSALKLLRDAGIEPQIVEYLRDPPTRAELRHLLDLLRLRPRDLLRRREPEYRRLGLDRPDVTDSAILTELSRHPRLLERPIVVWGKRKAVLARPASRLTSWLR